MFDASVDAAEMTSRARVALSQAARINAILEREDLMERKGSLGLAPGHLSLGGGPPRNPIAGGRASFRRCPRSIDSASFLASAIRASIAVQIIPFGL